MVVLSAADKKGGPPHQKQTYCGFSEATSEIAARAERERERERERAKERESVTLGRDSLTL